jgi:GxxExxY protein
MIRYQNGDIINPSHKQVTNGWLRLRKIDLRSEAFVFKNVPPREERGQARFNFSLPRSPVCCHLFTSRVNTREIILGAIDVHKAMGPGLLESAYKACLSLELRDRGLKCKEEILIPITYKHHQIDCGFRIDLLVEDEVVVELKAIEQVLPVHEAQILTYLRLLKKQVGLLMKFNVPILKKGLKRFVLNAREEVQEPEWIK